jgi:hypothetical protein
MYVMVRRYEVDPSSVDAIMRIAGEGYLPRVSSSPGFVAYYVLMESANVVATVSVYQTQAQMEAASHAVAGWVREHLAPLFPHEPLVIAGNAPAFRVGK